MPDYTILLIDYDPKSIERMRGPLVGAGYRVEVAKNGLAGLETFRATRPSLVLVEAMLPKKHGFEVCQEIKLSESGRSVPVIIVTAVYRGRKYRSQAFHLYKCDEYLEKPFSDEKLVEVVGRFLPKADRTARPAEPVAVAPTGPATEEAPAKVAAAPPVEPPPRYEEPMAEFTEDDIMSTLDAIMPDEKAARSASR